MTAPRHEAVLTALELAPEQGMTLEDIAELSSYPAASCSSAIRELRKPQYGGYKIQTLSPPAEADRRSCYYRLERTPCYT